MPDIYHYRAVNVPEGAQHVFIAIPVGQPTDAAMVDFMWGVRGELIQAGIHADLCLIAGHCHVDDCRNWLVHEFLQNSACTDFLFVDADTVSSHDAVVRILAHDRDVVAGIYPYKGDRESYPVRLLADRPMQAEADGCVEVQMVPTGFLRIRRAAMERVEAVVPGYWTKEVKQESGERPIPLMFERETEYDGIYQGRKVGDRWGGDYNFCRKWLALGGKVYVDPTLFFRHYGTKAFKGNLGIHWAKTYLTATPGFDEAIAEIRDGSEMIALFERLSIDWGNEYSAPAELLSAMSLMVAEATGPVLETGSGLSTIIIGLAAMRSGVQVHALEHDVEHYQRTIAALKRYGITSVRLHYAPLRRHEYGSEGRSCLWYEIPADLPESFALVFCDGPQRRYGRDGLMKLLGERIERANVIFDDADDAAEMETVNAWAKVTGRSVHIIETMIRPFAATMPAEAKVSTAA